MSQTRSDPNVRYEGVLPSLRGSVVRSDTQTPSPRTHRTTTDRGGVRPMRNLRGVMEGDAL